MSEQEQDFASMFEASVKARQFHRGQTIEGTIVVNDYQEQAGIIDLELVGVVLQNPSDQTFCTIDGTIVTTGVSF